MVEIKNQLELIRQDISFIEKYKDNLNGLTNDMLLHLKSAELMFDLYIDAVKQQLQAYKDREDKLNISELKEALELYKEKWTIESSRLPIDNDQKIKYSAMIYLAQWIINSNKGTAIDITKILNEEVK